MNEETMSRRVLSAAELHRELSQWGYLHLFRYTNSDGEEDNFDVHIFHHADDHDKLWELTDVEIGFGYYSAEDAIMWMTPVYQHSVPELRDLPDHNGDWIVAQYYKAFSEL